MKKTISTFLLSLALFPQYTFACACGDYGDESFLDALSPASAFFLVSGILFLLVIFHFIIANIEKKNSQKKWRTQDTIFLFSFGVYLFFVLSSHFLEDILNEGGLALVSFIVLSFISSFLVSGIILLKDIIFIVFLFLEYCIKRLFKSSQQIQENKEKTHSPRNP